MKKICTTLALLLICTGLWAQHNFSIKEATPGYFNGTAPSTFINSCQLPTERIFELKVFVNSPDDLVDLKKVYFTTTCSTGVTVTSPTSSTNGTYVAATSQTAQHIAFTIKTKDTFIRTFLCELRADWDYHDKITTVVNGVSTTQTTTTVVTDKYLKDYWYICGMTDPTLRGFPEKKQCGKRETISVHMKYENDLDNYTITANNATVVVSTIVKGGSTCNPTLDFDLETERCGDVTFTINRTNAVDSRTESYLITNEFEEAGTEYIENLGAGGLTEFCLANGSVNPVLKGPFNEHFFGTARPNGILLSDLHDACSGIEATWSIYSTTTPGGISHYSVNDATDFGYGSFIISQDGEYIIQYTLNACGKQAIRRIKLSACSEPPVLATVPPIDLQYVCSLGEPICAPITGPGCYNKITATSSDIKLLATSSNQNLCLGSIFTRYRTSQLNVIDSNACGSDNAIWDIIIDHPEHCQENNFMVQVQQGPQSIVLLLEPSAERELYTKKQGQLSTNAEILQKVLVYDMNGLLVWSQNSPKSDNRVEVPSNQLKAAGTYVVQMITNQQTYSKLFIKS